MSDAITHAHTWGRVTFRDFCHFVSVERACHECPQIRATLNERDFGSDPIQIAFADASCARCRELLRGREPDTWKGER